MLDYGVRHELADAGAFPSRLDAAAWARADRERAAEAGVLLAANVRATAEAENRGAGPYEAFLSEFNPVSDPFLHELRVHLFRRDRYLETADWHLDDAEWRARDITVAVREDAFLERFAPNTLRAAQLAWREAERAERTRLDLGTPYTSRVAEGVVTRVREREVALAWAVGLVALVAAAQLNVRRGPAA